MRTNPSEAVCPTNLHQRCLACRSWDVLSIILVCLLYTTRGSVWGQDSPVETDGEIARIVTATSRKVEARQARQLDPRNDGWETEAFSSQASQQLKRLGDLLTSNESITDERLSGIVDSQVLLCSRLMPESLVTVYSDASVAVRRPSPNEKVATNDVTQPVLQKGHAALEEIRKRFHGTNGLKFKFKLFRVEVKNTISTKQFLAISGRTSGGLREHNSTWRIDWTQNDRESPLIRQIVLEEFEEVVTRVPEATLFSDCTGSVCGNLPGFRDHLSYGINYWQRRIEKNLSMHYFGHSGLAIGDVNGDGLEDLYVCQAAGVPNKLFVQQPDGSVSDMAAQAGVDVLNPSRGVLLVDADNDGDQDLHLTTALALLVFENDGQGTFQLARNLMNVSGGYSLAATDYDNDGDLDVYVCVYYRKPGDARALAYPIPYHDANNGGRNFLLRNDTRPGEKITYTDVTSTTGMEVDNHRFSFATTWEDFDEDGDQDLYVTNDYGRNCLYRNRLTETGTATFESVAEKVGLEDTAFGMSACWGDCNNDGRVDLYVGNMFSGAGNRIAFQPRFQQHAPGDVKAKLQRTARGNSLFLQQSDRGYRDASIASGAFQGRWAWGSIFVDVNNDGWEDIVVANGFVTGNRLDDL